MSSWRVISGSGLWALGARKSSTATDLWLGFRQIDAFSTNIGRDWPPLRYLMPALTAITGPIICISLACQSHVMRGQTLFFARPLLSACLWSARVFILAADGTIFSCGFIAQSQSNVRSFVCTLLCLVITHKKSFVCDAHICCSGNGQDQKHHFGSGESDSLASWSFFQILLCVVGIFYIVLDVLV